MIELACPHCGAGQRLRPESAGECGLWRVRQNLQGPFGQRRFRFVRLGHSGTGEQ